MRVLSLVFLLPISFAFGQELDLSKFNFDNNQTTTLRGSWEFYWGKLLSPTDSIAEFNNPEIVRVPHGWFRDGKNEMFGVATYRVKLKLPEGSAGQLAIFFPFLRCAGKIFVDGIVIDSLGTVDSKNYKSKLGSLLVAIPNKPIVDLVIQVSNYDYRWGGLGSLPRIGKVSTLTNSVQAKNGLDIFFVGSILALAIYLITMFFLYREGYSFLFLSLICLAVVFRSVTTESSSLLLPTLLPNIGWHFWKKVEFFSVYSVVTFFPLYVSHVFPNESNKKIDLVFVVVTVVLCATVVFTSHPVYVLLLDVCHLGLLSGFAYACVIATRAWKKKNSDAKTLFIGILVTFPFIFLEMLKNSILRVPIPFTHLVEFGVLLFLLFQVYVLANHYAMTYQELEVVVKNKTAELTESNEIKNKMLAILSHDVRGPVNNLKASMNMFNRGRLTEDELKPMTRKIETQAGKVSLLIENILLLVKSQISGFALRTESFCLADWVNGHFSLYGMEASEKEISINSTIPANILVKADKNIVSLVIRNLIANAIKFSNRGGVICVSADKRDDLVILSVTDTGEGMTEKQVQSILTNKASIRSVSGTEKETGIGLGLKLCREYLLKMGSDFEIRSVVGQGTTISITLPIG